ncbi:MAG: hypothetical protein OEY79_03520 [Anaplasmataceae bacterium]|nr:hypothetical protein [Anaplasmataceae bacterium]
MASYLITAKKVDIRLSMHRMITIMNFSLIFGTIAMAAIGGLKLTHPDFFQNITNNTGIALLAVGIVILLGSLLLLGMRMDSGHQATTASAHNYNVTMAKRLFDPIALEKK